MTKRVVHKALNKVKPLNKDLKEINFRPLFPHVVTLMGFAFGVSSINMAFWGNWQMAIFFIMLSGVFDILDGQVASRLNVVSRFGAELDSLSDLVTFGVSPAIVMYFWTMNADLKIMALSRMMPRAEAIGISWGIVVFVAMCCAARLARFNTALDEEKPPYWASFFTGLPAPGGAGVVLFPMILWLATGQSFDFLRSPACVTFFMVAAGVLMVSRVPMLGLKYLRVPREYTWIVGVIGFATMAGLIVSPWRTMSLIGIAYMIGVGFGIRRFIAERRCYK